MQAPPGPACGGEGKHTPGRVLRLAAGGRRGVGVAVANDMTSWRRRGGEDASAKLDANGSCEYCGERERDGGTTHTPCRVLTGTLGRVVDTTLSHSNAFFFSPATPSHIIALYAPGSCPSWSHRIVSSALPPLSLSQLEPCTALVLPTTARLSMPGDLSVRRFFLPLLTPLVIHAHRSFLNRRKKYLLDLTHTRLRETNPQTSIV